MKNSPEELQKEDKQSLREGKEEILGEAMAIAKTSDGPIRTLE